ncbi:cobalamin B12-binding domain-containing protein [Nocardioides ferulae]|uniref:cobalamin B12-binding domain-containing protein n=1 Tax=Nocardioides ferulae TaxID=2340821 RepID=UPI0013DDE62C|nr:cobalamin-dependent protein [Nocardioides ferulae]
MSRSRLRIVLAGPAGDVVDESLHLVEALARALRDAGHEVVYAGAAEDAERLAATAVQEDADLVGLCLGAGDRSGSLAGRVAGRLADAGAPEVSVFEVGGAPLDAPGSGAADRPGSATSFAADVPVGDVVGWVAEVERSAAQPAGDTTP